MTQQREERERIEWGGSSPPSRHGLALPGRDLAGPWPRLGGRSGAQGGAERHRRRGWRAATPRRRERGNGEREKKGKGRKKKGEEKEEEEEKKK